MSRLYSFRRLDLNSTRLLFSFSFKKIVYNSNVLSVVGRKVEESLSYIKRTTLVDISDALSVITSVVSLQCITLERTAKSLIWLRDVLVVAVVHGTGEIVAIILHR